MIMETFELPLRNVSTVILLGYRLASKISKLSIIQIGKKQLPSMSFLHVNLNILLHILFSNRARMMTLVTIPAKDRGQCTLFPNRCCLVSFSYQTLLLHLNIKVTPKMHTSKHKWTIFSSSPAACLLLTGITIVVLGVLLRKHKKQLQIFTDQT